jgi:hypothetical protein
LAGKAISIRTSSLPLGLILAFTKISQNQPVFRSTPTQKTKFPTEKWNLVNSIPRLNSMTPVLPKTPFGSTGTCFGPLKIQRNSVEFLR